MKAVIYARVSTEDQTTDNQVPVLMEFAKNRGWEVIEVYEEETSAWKSGHQVKLAKLLKDAWAHKFDIVLVWALDRLSREGAAAILALVNRLKKDNIKIISYQETWTEAPGELGELLFAIVGWVARMESKRRSERTLAGLSRAKAEGKKLGRREGSRDKKKRNRRRTRNILVKGE